MGFWVRSNPEILDSLEFPAMRDLAGAVSAAWTPSSRHHRET
jgi:hypothetical protein